MDHIGIDLGSRDSQVCVRNSAGEIIEEARAEGSVSMEAHPVTLKEVFLEIASRER